MTDNKQWSIKHRPTKFESLVVGNPEILKEAERAANKLTAALIVGPSGNGKTTLARCFSHHINGSLKGVIEESTTDRGVDYIRKLEGRVKFAPPAKKWVVIIDEVHNLTKEAKTAMLKLIEDPPHEKVLFLLCTNHPYLLPKEIKNRCRIFEIQTPELEAGTKALMRVLKREKMDASIKEMKKLAAFAFTSSGHCMRQALQILESLFDQYNSGVSIKSLLKHKSGDGENKQTINEVQKTAGSLLLALYDAFESKDASDAIKYIIPTMTTVDPSSVIGSMQGTLYYGFALENGGNWQWQAKDYKQVFAKKKPDIQFISQVLIALTEIKTELTTALNDPVVVAGSKLSNLAYNLTGR